MDENGRFFFLVRTIFDKVVFKWSSYVISNNFQIILIGTLTSSSQHIPFKLY